MQVLLNVCSLWFRYFHFRNTIFIVFIFLFFWVSVYFPEMGVSGTLDLLSFPLDVCRWFSALICLSVCFLPRSEKWARLLLSDALKLRAVLVDLPLTQRSVSSPSPAPRPTCWSKSTTSPCPWAWRSTASLNSTWFRFAHGFILC